MNTMPVDGAKARPWRLADLGQEGASIVGLAEFRGAVLVATEAPGGLARLDPASGDWTLAHELPEGDSAVTGLAVLQGPGDAHPCLYATWGSRTGGGLLRSEDGLAFAPVLERQGRGGGRSGLRAPAVWSGRLVLAAFGEGTDGHLPANAVLASLDPSAGGWAALSEPSFGDPDNREACALAVAGRRLHAAVRNDQRGFQVWTTEGPGEAPRWTKAIDEGARRFGGSPSVAGLVAWGPDLYVGTDHPFPAGPDIPVPAAELLRLEPDGHWEVVAGEMRMTPQGLKVPVALLGPGFGDATATRIVPGAGAGALLAVTDPGGRLWRSGDGERWDLAWSGLGLDGAPSGVAATSQGLFVALGATLVGLPNVR